MLNNHQTTVLNQLAQGRSHYEIGASNGLNQTELNITLRDMQTRLGAKTLAHLMHRAWELGLLGMRTLCLCLAVLGASHIADTKAVRNVRVVRTAPKTPARYEIA